MGRATCDSQPRLRTPFSHPERKDGAFQEGVMPATSADKLKLFRIRLAPKGRRKPPLGPDIEGKILDAAEFVFGHFGFRGATTALIAKKASIAKPHIYYYFEDKEDLYRAILERAMNMWARDIDSLDTATDIKTILTQYIHKKVDFSRDHPHLSRIYANEIISGAQYVGSFIEKVSTPLLLDKVKTVDQWVASGAIRPISAADLFFCIWAMTQAYADFSSQMNIMKQKRQLEQIVADAAVKVTTLETRGPSSPPPPLTPRVLGPLEKLSAQFWPGLPVLPVLQPGATDGEFLNAVGIPTYGIEPVFAGPDLGNIHGLNEYVGVKSLLEGRDFLYRLVKIYADGK